MVKKILSVLICSAMLIGFNTGIAFADTQDISTTVISVEGNSGEIANEETTSDEGVVTTTIAEDVSNEEITISSEEVTTTIATEDISQQENSQKETNEFENYDDAVLYLLLLVIALLSSLGCYRTTLLEKRLNKLENIDKTNE